MRPNEDRLRSVDTGGHIWHDISTNSLFRGGPIGAISTDMSLLGQSRTGIHRIWAEFDRARADVDHRIAPERANLRIQRQLWPPNSRCDFVGCSTPLWAAWRGGMITTPERLIDRCSVWRRHGWVPEAGQPGSRFGGNGGGCAAFPSGHGHQVLPRWHEGLIVPTEGAYGRVGCSGYAAYTTSERIGAIQTIVAGFVRQDDTSRTASCV